MTEHSTPDPNADPNAVRDESRAAQNIGNHLVERGVRLFGDESPDELGDLIEEVERFESAISALGADSMINAPDSVRPQDRRLVLPERRDDESVVRYAARVNAASEDIRRAAASRDSR